MGQQFKKIWEPIVIAQVIGVSVAYVGILAAVMYQVASAAGFVV